VAPPAGDRIRVSDSIRTITVAAAVLGLAFAWLAVRTARTPGSSHERLVAELRMTQLASLILVLLSGAYIGFAAWQESRLGAGLDVAFALGFLTVAFTALTRDPRESLTLLALAFAGHALIDLAHGPGWLPSSAAPRWYLIGCASFNVCLGALCYLPMIRR
jgi:hypothetical protein